MSCERLWQAEALADGRLGPEHAASFERHAAGCAECREERRALERLRAIGKTTASHAHKQLDHRRARERLLAAANRGIVTPRRTWAFALAACLAVSLVSVLSVRAVSLRRSRGTVALSSPTYRVFELQKSEWSVLDPGPATRLALRAGWARFHVDHLEPGRRFLVNLPDGEIEVRGTDFIVRVDGTTREVVVETGVVALRIAGNEHILTAGMRWSAEPESAKAVSIATTTVPTTTTAPTKAATVVMKTMKSAAPKAPPASSESTIQPKPNDGGEFNQAMSAFGAGNYATADALFATFAKSHPDDARAEDAAFLRAMCASRRGDDKAAKQLAKAYLARYPNGFHASDARALAE